VADLLWDDVSSFFDPDLTASLPDVSIPDASGNSGPGPGPHGDQSPSVRHPTGQAPQPYLGCHAGKGRPAAGPRAAAQATSIWTGTITPSGNSPKREVRDEMLC